MRRARVFVLLWMMLASAVATSAAASSAGTAGDEVGSVTYVEGSPQIVRDGKPVYEQVEPGYRVESFDYVHTDEATVFEFSFYPATGIDASVLVEPGSHVSFDLSGPADEQAASIELIHGSVRVAVRRLTDGSRVRVRASGATIDVRGTVFSVSGGPAGELLVSTEEGLVEVTDEEGRSLYASPGEAVEIDEEAALFRTRAYDRDELQAFRREWQAERAVLFVENAPRILRFTAQRYRRARDTFIEAYGELMGHRDVIDEWIDQARRGVRPRTPDHGEYDDVGEALRRVRGAMARFEPVRVRLEQVVPFLRELGLEDLYRTVTNDRRLMAERSATVRHVLKVYGRLDHQTPPDR